MSPSAALPRCLVRLPSWLGDLVAAEPVLRCLHGHYEQRGQPEALSLAGPEALLALFEGRFAGARRIAHRGRGAEQPRAWAGHDRALLLTGSFRSAWIAWRASIPERFGLIRGGRGWLLTGGFEPARAAGQARTLGLARFRGPFASPVLARPVGAAYQELLGLLGFFVSEAAPQLWLAPAAQAQVDLRLGALGLDPLQPFLLAAVGGRPGSAKSLEPAVAARLLGQLAGQLGWPLVLTSGPGEAAQAQATQAELAALGCPAQLAFDQGLSTLSELIGLASRTALFIGTDSGSRHVARASGARCLALIGPQDPRHSVEHAARERQLSVELACRPCGREVCPLPGPAERACLRQQSPEALWIAARGLLEAWPLTAPTALDAGVSPEFHLNR